MKVAQVIQALVCDLLKSGRLTVPLCDMFCSGQRGDELPRQEDSQRERCLDAKFNTEQGIDEADGGTR